MSPASPLMSVEEALRRILAAAHAPDALEEVALREAAGRTLGIDLTAGRTQPPMAVSAMDGYAVRARDVAEVPAEIRLIGESAAGRGFRGRLGPGETVRIFTGAPLPEGADAVLIQENARRDGHRVVALETVTLGRNIRPAGQDFARGDLCLRAGQRLSSADVALAAAMNHPILRVTRRPRVAILATGDELVSPGVEPGPDQIVASNNFAVAGIAEAAGAVVIDLGIAPDDVGALAEAFARARAAEADLLVTLGGASVGDHDLVQPALLREGLALDFWRIAMRPGKPLMHGRLGAMQVLGLPGNPVSAIVCGLLYVRPLVRALSRDPRAGADPAEPALLGSALAGNDGRQDYIRARLEASADGPPRAYAGPRQDSSLLKALSEADCLIVRPPHAPPSPRSEPCRVIRLRRSID